MAEEGGVGVDVLRWADQVEEPWRNGRGTTTVLASSPASGTDFDWRISIAQVTGDAEFSAFPGVDRLIMPLDEEPITLVVDGERHDLARFTPFAFDGGASTRCEVAGAMRDLNVMWRRDVVRAHLRVLSGGRIEVGPGEIAYVVGLTGQPLVAGVALSFGDALRVDATSIDIGAGGSVAAIWFRRTAEHG